MSSYMLQDMMQWKCVRNISTISIELKNLSVILQKTKLTSICHHTLKCQCKAIMRIRKMQALRNEMPEQNSQDGFNGVFLPHVSAR